MGERNYCKILETLVEIAKVQSCHTKKFNILVKARMGQWQNSTCILTKWQRWYVEGAESVLSNAEDFI